MIILSKFPQSLAHAFSSKLTQITAFSPSGLAAPNLGTFVSSWPALTGT